MNQLQSLLHDSLIATGHVQQCAIIRRKDTSLRSSTVGFSVYFSKDEIDHLKWKCEVYCHDITSSAKWISTKKSALYLESDFVPDYNEPIREQPSLDNIHALVHSFTNSSQARREGLKFQEIVYECVRADRFSVYAKHENSGIILVRTATLLLVATYTPEMSPSICVEAVEKLADYFREKGK